MGNAKVEIGGRSFEPVTETTALHDFWVMKQVRATGLALAAQRPDESYEDFAVRLCGEIAESGKAFLLIGALLVPEGREPLEWTPEMAEETARFLEGMTSLKDKNQIFTLTAQLMLGFFGSGLLSFETSKPSSASARATLSEESEPTTLVPSASESGALLSASSAASTTTEPRASRQRGRFGRFWSAIWGWLVK